MDFSYYDAHLNKKTIGKYDITPLFANEDVFRNLIEDLCNCINTNFDRIACQEATGFVLGAALAQRLQKALLLIRKEGKLPTLREHVSSIQFSDYSGKQKTFEINNWDIKEGESFLLVDDWVETGGAMFAAANLIEKHKGVVSQMVSIAAHRSEKTQVLFDRYNLKTLTIFE